MSIYNQKLWGSKEPIDVESIETQNGYGWSLDLDGIKEKKKNEMHILGAIEETGAVR